MLENNITKHVSTPDVVKLFSSNEAKGVYEIKKLAEEVGVSKMKHLQRDTGVEVNIYHRSGNPNSHSSHHSCLNNP